MVVVVVVRAVGSVENRSRGAFCDPVLRKRGFFCRPPLENRPKGRLKTREKLWKTCRRAAPWRVPVRQFVRSPFALFHSGKFFGKAPVENRCRRSGYRRFSTFSADFSTTPFFRSQQLFAPRFPQFFPHFHILSPLPTRFSTPFPHPVENSVETVEKSCGERGRERPWDEKTLGLCPKPHLETS